MQLSIVVPCHNEENSVKELCAAVGGVMSAELPDVDYRIILVDDGSTDRTAALMERAAAEDDHVQAVIFSRNFGKEAAMLAGLRASTGDYVVIMDGDLQHPVELIPRMFAIIESQPVDQVIARRDRAGDGMWRTWLSRLYYRGVNALVDVKLEDGAGDFRMLSKRAVQALLTLPEANRFSKGLFSWIGFRTETIEYPNVARGAGSSSWSIGSLINYGIDGVISFNAKPLRSVIWGGSAIFAVALVYLIILVIRYFMIGAEAPGYVTTIAAIALFGGAQLLGLGIIGEYIGRVYQEVKARPHYIVQDNFGDKEA